MRRRALLLALAGSTAAGLTAVRSLAAPGIVPPELRDFEAQDGSEAEYRPSLTPVPDPDVDVESTTLLATIGERSDVLVGDARGPHDVALVNASDEPRTLSIGVSVDGDRILRRAPTVDPRTSAVVGLLEPATYVVETGGPDETERVTIDPHWFDCNASTTYVVVDADGGVATTGSATTMGCGPLSDL